MSLTVACVLSQGPGNYSEEHAQRLRAQVAEHIRQPYEFVCLRDSPFSGYWAKVSLFEPGRFSGRVLYLDLDVTVKASLDELANYDAPFAIVKDFTQLGFNSSVMAWDAGAADNIFAGFNYDEHSQRFRGDQSWIFHIKPDARRFPRGWVQSFKVACMRGGFEPDLRVVAFHGWPRPWELESYV